MNNFNPYSVFNSAGVLLALVVIATALVYLASKK